jgi:thymidylate synthase (FAD)
MKFRDRMLVELVKSAAADTDVVFAARVSTGSEGDSEEKDAGLISYLMKNRHGSPFEHTSMTFRIEAPIFVIREFQRHRAGWSYNEESGRYKQLDPEFYLPSHDRKIVQRGKPGAYHFQPGTADQMAILRRTFRDNSFDAYARYQEMLDIGIAREVARMVLPLNTYSSMYATCNARSLMHFLSLRTTNELARVPSFPQREIEMVAEQMETELIWLMPLTWTAFNKHGRVAP